MAKKSQSVTDLRKIAKWLRNAGVQSYYGVATDAVSVCEYVSRKLGTELTVTQGGKVLNLLSAMEKESAKQIAEKKRRKEIEEMQDAQGWYDATIYKLAFDFLMERSLGDEFVKFMAEVQKEEEASIKDSGW